MMHQVLGGTLANDEVSLGEIGQRFLGGYRILVVSVLGAAFLAMAYVAVSPADYRSEVRIRIDPRQLRMPSPELEAKAIADNRMAIAFLDSQVRVLKSSTVLGYAIDTIGLNHDPHYATAAPSLWAQALRFLPGSTENGGPVRVKDTPTLQCEAAPPITSACRTPTFRAALDRLAKDVTVRRAAGSYVVVVQARSNEPAMAKRIADAITTAYIEDIRRTRSRRLAEAGRQVTSGLSALQEAVELDEDRIVEASRRLQIVRGSDGSVVDQQLKEMTKVLGEARLRSQDLQTQSDYLARLSRSDSGLDAVQFPDFPGIEALRVQEASLARQEGAMVAKLGPRHPDVMRLSEQRKRNRTLLQRELTRTAEAIRNEAGRARAVAGALSVRAEELKRTVLATSAASVEVRQLERIAKADGTVLQVALRRAAELDQVSLISPYDVRLLGPADTPRGPTVPRSSIVAAAALAGLFVGGAWVATRYTRVDRQVPYGIAFRGSICA
ncbi:hypothetical protein AFCDBAGC_4839 [Methylobacterium cerastii]|uniref:Lipopolysaccharide biosynthesis protein n=1 Tax=Methylobacterium cerastii TaxID=932741 RepID=A0ABQ4QQD9_9HYPH|nr:GumC family protein [Methylobacterium cerastii]GJD46954.1 hypothetical protein AFCDBAGC_4839 [Methylobacterium cerastii]